jgi:hypothetical protein
MAGAAGWLGCVAGNGSVRRNATSGVSVESKCGGKGGEVKDGPPGGAPAEASATSFVKSWASFLVPASIRRAVSRGSRSDEAKAMLAFSRSSASVYVCSFSGDGLPIGVS